MSKPSNRLTDFGNKHFSLIISNETDIKIPLDVDTSQYKKVENIINLIANKLQMQPNDFTIESHSKDTLISSIKEKSNIQIKFLKTCKDINFFLPDKEHPIIIKKCNELCFENVIPKFKEFSLYVSQECSKSSLNFEIFDSKIKAKKLKLDFVPIGKSITVKFEEKAVVIDFKAKRFLFKAGEYISKSENYIKDSLNIAGASICPENSKLKNKKILQQNEKYSVSSLCTYKFIGPNNKISYQKLEYDATVSDARNILALVYSTKPEDILIYDGQNKPLLNKKLSEIKDLRFDIVGKQNISLTPGSNPEKAKKSQPSSTPKIASKPKSADTKKQNSKPATPPSNPISKPPSKPANPTKSAPPSKSKTLEQKQPVTPSSKSTNKDENSPKPKTEEPKPHPKPKPKLHVTISTAPVSNNDDDKDDGDDKKSSSLLLDIYFIFEESTGKTLKPPKHKIDPDTTISELSSMISKQYGIPEIVEIKYKEGDEKVTVDRDMRIDDIRDEMIQKEGGRSKNVLYIGHRRQKAATEKQSAKKRKSFAPTISAAKNDLNSESDSEKEKEDTSKYDHYVFEFDEDERDILLRMDSLLSDHISLIKKKYNIDEKDEIGFKVAKTDEDDDENDGEIITDINQKMKNFEDKKIIVYLTSEDAESIYLTVKRMKDPNAIKRTYTYMTNVDDQKREAVLDTKATVKSLKRAIHRIKQFRNSRLCDIKILFAGKDLLDGLVLDKLNIGNNLLYAYIRSTDDILLMTAKALVVDDEDNEDEDDDDDED